MPGLALVEIDVGYGTAGEGAVEDFLEEVEGDELLVGGVETEARRQLLLSLAAVLGQVVSGSGAVVDHHHLHLIDLQLKKTRRAQIHELDM